METYRLMCSCWQGVLSLQEVEPGLSGTHRTNGHAALHIIKRSVNLSR